MNRSRHQKLETWKYLDKILKQYTQNQNSKVKNSILELEKILKN